MQRLSRYGEAEGADLAARRGRARRESDEQSTQRVLPTVLPGLAALGVFTFRLSMIAGLAIARRKLKMARNDLQHEPGHKACQRPGEGRARRNIDLIRVNDLPGQYALIGSRDKQMPCMAAAQCNRGCSVMNHSAGVASMEAVNNRLGGRLGPAPGLALLALTELDVTDERIGRYFGLDAECVAAIRAEYLSRR